MAEDATADDEAASAGTHRKKDAQRQRILIIVGVISLIIVYLMLRKSSSASSGSNASQPDLAAQEAALASQMGGGSLGYGAYGSGANGQSYSMANDPIAQQMLTDLQAIQNEVANGGHGSGTTPLNLAPASSDITPTTPATASNLPQYTGITSAQEAQQLISAGVPVYEDVAGNFLQVHQSGPGAPWEVGGTPLAPGTGIYEQTPAPATIAAAPRISRTASNTNRWRRG